MFQITIETILMASNYYLDSKILPGYPDNMDISVSTPSPGTATLQVTQYRVHEMATMMLMSLILNDYLPLKMIDIKGS